MTGRDIYATPRIVTDLQQCYFYHTMEIPGHGLVQGSWDLRGRESDYLGHVDFKNKRVLEMGTASGFFCFFMESQGAQVVAYDLSTEFDWDVVPYAQYDYRQHGRERRAHLNQINNAWWLSHAAHKSQAKVVYGTVYAVPPEIGKVDIATFGSLLLHVRDPFYALQNALRLTEQTVVITEPVWRPSWKRRIAGKIIGPHMTFFPDPLKTEPRDTWWMLTPEIVQRMVGVLGFEKSQVTYHRQNLEGREILNFTVVAHRTRPMRLE